MNLDDLLARAQTFDNPKGHRQIRWASIALLFLSLSTCLANGANGPINPSLADAGRVPPFAQVAFRLVPTTPPSTTAPPTTAAGATVAPTEAGRLCALLADTLLTRQRNLAGRGDLAGYSAMIVDYGELTVEPFAPQSISIGLTVAFYDSKGTFISTGDTAPCATQAGCPPLAATAPYRYALLLLQGQLAALGGPTARLEVGGACPHQT